MIEHYAKLKKLYPNAILLLRIGDFYETFDQDARTVSEVCDIVLAARRVNGEHRDIAGFPYHVAQDHIAQLIARGYTVAVAEPTSPQMEMRL